MRTREPDEIDVLYEDNHLLVVNKPAGLPTMGDADRETLHSLAGAYLKRKFNKPHGVYVGIVSRLDSMTSGVIVLARTSKAAARLNTQFADNAKRLNRESATRGSSDAPPGAPESIRKTYLAIVRPEPYGNAPLSPRGRMLDNLYKDDAAHRMRVTALPRDNAKPASLIYQTLASEPSHAFVAVAPLTGRKHQIRVQFAARGWPILGDRKYGSTAVWQSGIALHSYQLTIEHPTRREPMTFRCPPPESWASVETDNLGSPLSELNWNT